MTPGLGKVSWKYLWAALFLTGLFLIAWNFMSFIAANAVDMPYWDEWDMSYFILGKRSLREILLYQHVVHRIGFGLLIMMGLASLSNWSQIVEIYFIAFLLLSTAGIFLYIKYRSDRNVSLLDLLVPLLFLNILQYQNLLWGFQISYVLPLFLLSLWVLTAVAVGDRRLRDAILTVLSLFSAYSSMQGLLLPVITIVFVLVEMARERRGGKAAAVLTAAVNALIIGTYFIGFVFSLEGKPPMVLKIAAAYFLSAVGTGFLSIGRNIAFDLLMTLLVAAFLVVGAVRYYRDDKAVGSFVGTVLASYALLYICLITSGRGFAEQEVNSRYITYTVLAPAGLFFIFSDLRYGRFLKVLLLAVLLVNTVRYNGDTVRMIGGLANKEKIAVESYKNGLPGEECYKIYPLYPDRARLESLIPKVFEFKKIPTNNLAL